MRSPRIFTDQPLAAGDLIRAEAEAAHHLRRVLRLRPGAELILFNGDGRDYQAQLTESPAEGAWLQVKAVGAADAAAALEVRLGIGISKGERMDFVMQKAVELGVTEITPLFTEHGVVQLRGERLERRLEHWRRVAIGACEQCGRNRLPRLHPATELTAWLAQPAPGSAILLDPNAPLALPQLPPPLGAVTLLVGAEGGLAETERAQAAAAGFQPVRLGPRVLRTETAPLAAIAAIQALWGDFRG
jgi:16S rRNA (uracil1498-N3)-methyltransferase